MPVELITGPRPALEAALADAVAARQDGDPLRAVHVLVAGSHLSAYLRRRLATFLGGHLGVKFVTAGQLGILLGERRLLDAGRRPLPFLADRVLASEVAARHEGYFAAVAQMPGFTTALHRTLRELRVAGVSADALAQAAGDDAKLQALADLYAEHARRRAGFYSPEDGLAAADPAPLHPAGLIVYAVWEPTAVLLEALRAVARAGLPLTVFAPATGTDADAVLQPLHAAMAELGAERRELRAPDPAEPTALDHVRARLFTTPSEPAPDDATVRVVSAPDPEREAREAVRACLRWAEQGIALHEIAIAYRHGDAYRAALDTALREAGLPAYLHEGVPLSERPLGRQTAALLGLLDGDLERSAVTAFLADARLPDATWERYGGVPAARWDAMSREAGIVRGAAMWDERLAAYAADLTERHGREPPAWVSDRLGVVDGLRRFVADLAAAIDAAPRAATWADYLDYFGGLLRTYVDGAEPILDVLDGLAELDVLTTELPFERARDAVLAVVDGLRAADVLEARQGAFGLRGVQVIDVNSLRSLGYRAVVLLGVAERSFPPPPRQDPLLLDHERAALNAANGWALPLRALGADAEPLQFAGAVAAAAERLQVSIPRARAGDERPQLPSSFARAVAAQLAGREVGAAELESIGAAHRRVPSGRLSALDPDEALSATERLRALLEHGDPAARGLAHRRQPRLARGEEAERARWVDHFTAFDGVVAPDAIEGHWALDRPRSARALEDYAACPYRFLLGHVLRIEQLREPETTVRLDALNRGSLIHAVLERFMRERVPLQDRATELRRLNAIAEEELAAAQERGETGYPLLWRIDRTAILDDLERWLDRERADAQPFDSHDYEVRFGRPYRGGEPVGPLTSDEPLRLDLGEGLELELNGRIDRVDWRARDKAFRVIDYKTGGNRATAGALKGGEALQLPLYLHAAAGALGVEPTEGAAEYFFVTRKGGFERVAFTGEDLAERQVDLFDLLRGMAGGIAGGDFHAEPEDRRCEYCDFDPVCDPRRRRIRRRKAADPRAVAADARREVKP